MKKHEDIHRSSDSLLEKNPKVFEQQLFSLKSLEDLVRKALWIYHQLYITP